METSTRSCRRQKETAEPGSAVQARGVISHVGATHGAKAPGRMSVWPNGPVVDGWSLANLLTPLCYRRERQPPKVLPMTRLSRLPLMQEHCLSSTAKRQIAPVGCRGTVGIGLQPFAAATAGHSGRAAWTRLFSPEMSCRWLGSTTPLSQRQEPTRWSCHSEAGCGGLGLSILAPQLSSWGPGGADPASRGSSVPAHPRRASGTPGRSACRLSTFLVCVGRRSGWARTSLVRFPTSDEPPSTGQRHLVLRDWTTFCIVSLASDGRDGQWP